MSAPAAHPWPRVAVLGAGAVGCYYGGMLARAGAPVTLIGRPAHVEAMRRAGGLQFEARGALERIAVSAGTEPSGVAGAPVVLFCVKSGDTESAARAIAPHLARDATLVSLQNGVDNAARLAPLVAAQVVAAVVYVGSEMAGPGHVRHMGRGELVVGARGGGDAQRAADVAALFERAGVPCRASADIDGELWGKLIANCAYNAISALSRLPYGRILASRWSQALMPPLVDEAVAVARAEGVRVDTDGLLARVLAIGEAMPGQFSSTAQDLARGRPTEIDALNGYVAERGAALGVPVPVNRTLHALVKLLELETTKPAR
jgi:2-dehydropantoate 2-reductase